MRKVRAATKSRTRQVHPRAANARREGRGGGRCVVIGINAITSLQREDLRAPIYVIKNMYVCPSQAVASNLTSPPAATTVRVSPPFFSFSFPPPLPHDLMTLTTDRPTCARYIRHLSSRTLIEYDGPIHLPPAASPGRIRDVTHREKLNDTKDTFREKIDADPRQSLTSPCRRRRVTRFSFSPPPILHPPIIGIYLASGNRGYV